MKHYASGSGYHYEYWYEGNRAYRSEDDCGTEFIFRLAAEGERGSAATVFLSTSVLRDWEVNHGRKFSFAERYAIAKVALFQAFDEHAGPAEVVEPVRVGALELDAIVERLNIE